MATTLNKVQYVDQEFSTAVARIKEFLQTYYPDEYNDYVNSNMGQALIDIVAYSEQNLMWYLNRKISDLYFPTAQTPNSISKLARMLGYKSKGATSSDVEITVTLSSGPYTFPVTINKGFKFNGPNNTIWEYRGNVPVVYAPGETVKTIMISQGYTRTDTFVSTGANSQVFSLVAVPTGKYVNVTTVIVTVGGVEWTEYSVIPFLNENAYETNLVTFPPFVKFGDGVQGNVPVVGAGIEISYVVTDGFRGRIVSNSIKEPTVGLIAQFQTIPLSISQPLPSVGGDDPEDVRSITVNAPLFQQTQDRAITKTDYDFLANQYANVARADAQILRSVSGDVAMHMFFDQINASVSGAVSGFYDQSVSSMVGMQTELTNISGAADTMEAGIVMQVGISTADVILQLDGMTAATNSSLATFKSAMDVLFGTISTDTSNIDTSMISMLDGVDTEIEVRRGNINLILDEVVGAVSGASVPIQNQVTSLINSAKGKLTELQTTVYSLNSTTKSNVNSSTADVGVQIVSADAEISSLSGTLDAAVSGYQSAIIMDMAAVETVAVSGVSAFNVSSGNSMNQMVIYFDQISANVAEISDLPYVVNAELQAVSAYLDEHLSDSCQANLVQVLVLGKDQARKYVAPLPETLTGLKSYLMDRREITQTISVVAGTDRVIDANVTIQVRVNKNAVEDDVIQQIQDSLTKSDTTPFGLLVEREFGVSLHVWDIDGAIRGNIVDGTVDYLNVEITGPVDYLDAAGNLIVPAGVVIQSGTVTITKLPRF